MRCPLSSSIQEAADSVTKMVHAEHPELGLTSSRFRCDRWTVIAEIRRTLICGYRRSLGCAGLPSVCLSLSLNCRYFKGRSSKIESSSSSNPSQTRLDGCSTEGRLSDLHCAMRMFGDAQRSADWHMATVAVLNMYCRCWLPSPQPTYFALSESGMKLPLDFTTHSAGQCRLQWHEARRAVVGLSMAGLRLGCQRSVPGHFSFVLFYAELLTDDSPSRRTLSIGK